MRKKTIKENQYWDTNPDAEISIRGFQSVVKSEKENMLVRNKNIENFREKKKQPKTKNEPKWNPRTEKYMKQKNSLDILKSKMEIKESQWVWCKIIRNYPI